MTQTEAKKLNKEIEEKIIQLSHDVIRNHAPKDAIVIGLKMQSALTSIEKEIIELVEA